MAINFGEGPPLAEANPWLKDDRERHLRILDVTERDSVIEGLPPFTPEQREELLKRLQEMDALARKQG